jgi:NodT family efflux transporter outer membrane factor (OMF) lipoprotein
MFAGCAVGPNYHRPALSPSAGYGAEATTRPSAERLHAGASAPEVIEGLDVPSQWWEVFHCADLDALVAQALKNSPTVDAAKAALRAAREQVRAQRGAFLPTVSASVQPTRQRFAPNLASPLQSGSDTYSLTTTQVSVSYTPDLFGANARAVESLVAQQDQQRFELEAARLTLATNVVQAAVQDAFLRAGIETTKSIIADQAKTAASYARQYQLGQVAKADLAAQEALLAQARATLPPLEKQFLINRDLLEALVGRTPGEPLEVGFSFQSLSLPDRLPLSLPAEIVAHRPDVRIAEAELHAASAEVGVAAAARWPSIQLEAGAGGAALGLTPAFNNSANFWSLAATLTQPIFEGGTLLHRERSAQALYDQAASQYQATVVGAFQNTADVLHALWADAEALQLAEEAETAASKGLEIVKRQLALGDLSGLAMLSAEQAAAQARLSTLQARANRYADVAALFQALGGGWWNSAEPAAAAGRGVSPR